MSMSIPSTLRERSQAALAAALARPWSGPLICVDATLGNGQDSLFLASTARELGLAVEIHSFDIQPLALQRAEQRLSEAGLCVRISTGQGAGAEARTEGEIGIFLHLQGHEDSAATLAGRYGSGDAGQPVEAGPCLAAVVFNLGFLPGADRKIVTRPESTLAALRGLLPLLAPGGLASVHMYAGHAGGAEEAAAVLDFFAHLSPSNWRVGVYDVPGKERNPEYLALAERL